MSPVEHIYSIEYIHTCRVHHHLISKSTNPINSQRYQIQKVIHTHLHTLSFIAFCISCFSIHLNFDSKTSNLINKIQCKLSLQPPPPSTYRMRTTNAKKFNQTKNNEHYVNYGVVDISIG